jgi:8-hydroxy-5-deazaflavin:NADPH oxidoreductase
MKIAMIGGGGVAQTLATKLISQGHDVVIGLRAVTADELAKERNMAQPLGDWAKATGGRIVTLPEAGVHGEVIFNATTGQGSIAALQAVGAANLRGKLLIDVANPLDFSQGMPPFLSPEYAGPTSLGEQIQKTFPETHVVKAFNTIAAAVMVDPALIPGDHDLFIAGNDAGAKARVDTIARSFGWAHIVDLGDISGARASEAILPLWVRLWMSGGTHLVNIHRAHG